MTPWFLAMLGGVSERVSSDKAGHHILGAGGPNTGSLTITVGDPHRNRRVVAVIHTRTNSTTGERWVYAANLRISGVDYPGTRLQVSDNSPHNNPSAMFEFFVPVGAASTGSLSFQASGGGTAWAGAVAIAWVLRGDYERVDHRYDNDASVACATGAAGIVLHTSSRGDATAVGGVGYDVNDLSYSGGVLSARAGRMLLTTSGATTLVSSSSQRSFAYSVKQR